MATDVSLVANAAEGDARELAAQRAGDRLAERGLAHAGRADEGDDRTRTTTPKHLEPALLAKFSHGQELDDAVLHIGQTGVVLVQDASRLDQVVVVLGAHVPGDVQHPVQVCADPPVFRVLLAGALQPVELAVDLGEDAFRHLRLRNPLAIAGNDVASTLVQLLLDRLQLLAQQELTLSLFHALGDIAADLLLQRGVGQDRLGPADQKGEALLEVERLQDLHLLLGRQVRRVAGKVCQVAWSLGGAQKLHDLRDAPGLDEVLQQGAVLARELERLLSRGFGVEQRVGLDPEGAADVGLAAAKPGAILAPDHEGLGAGWQLCRLAQAGGRANGAELAVDARNKQDQAVALAGSLDRSFLVVALDGKGDRHVWEDDDVVHGEDW